MPVDNVVQDSMTGLALPFAKLYYWSSEHIELALSDPGPSKILPAVFPLFGFSLGNISLLLKSQVRS